VREHDKEQILVLFTVAPTETYLERGALAVARLAGGVGASVRQHETELDVGVIAPHVHAVEIPGGVLHVRSEEPLESEAERAARFGAELLVLGLSTLERIVDARALVERRLAAAPLGPRERELCRLLVAGQTTSAITARMGLTDSSVRTYLKRIFAKMEVRSRLELVARLTEP
jgi:DNA-binding CsgD family transcriptional regulator